MSHEADRRPSTRQLVERAVEGDDRAFTRLVRRHYRSIFRWALARLGHPDEAEDVTQEVLVRLHRHLDSYASEASFTSWLYRVTANAAASYRRANQRKPAAAAGSRETTETRFDPVGRIQAQRAADLVRVYLEELAPRQREVLDLVDLQGFEPVEVGEMLGIKAVTVRTNLLRARRAIRAKLLQRHPALARAYARDDRATRRTDTP